MEKWVTRSLDLVSFPSIVIKCQVLIRDSGVRVPLFIVSPFTRGGKVFTERADHSSILQFLGM